MSQLYRAGRETYRLFCVGRSFEKNDFQPDGRRKPYTNIWLNNNTIGNVDPSYVLAGGGAGQAAWDLPGDARIRQANYELQYGQKAEKQKIVARIKPYFRDDGNPRMYDWIRVFGVAISSARPSEMCDIKISRQSM